VVWFRVLLSDHPGAGAVGALELAAVGMVMDRFTVLISRMNPALIAPEEEACDSNTLFP
jgi:hypothetical protein